MPARPFLKWCGGKATSAAEIIGHFPANWDREKGLYVEPFLGGGAVFFALQPKNALLCDINERLIRTYKGVRKTPEDVIKRLRIQEREHAKHGQSYYLDVRDQINMMGDSYLNNFDLASDFIFINKASFNGLYRVNSKDEINVPWGHDQKRKICDAENLRACALALQCATLMVNSAFDVDIVLPGTVIYCDPPYVPVSKTANFTGYTPGGFTYADQVKLLAKAIEWREQGAHVLLSQAEDMTLIEQYTRCGFSVKRLQARRNINSKGSARGPVNECLIY
jgi:DNA adenine methylase